MDRRHLIAALAAAFGLIPFRSARAQTEGRVWRVGVLISRSRPERLQTDAMGELPRAMAELGYRERAKVQYEWRFAEGNYRRLPDLAAELANLKVDVIVTEGTPAARAAKQASGTTPIVMVVSGDPVGTGLIKTLAQPGGNITGISQISTEVETKLLDLLVSIVPRLSNIAYLKNPDSPAATTVFENLKPVAQKVGVRLWPLDASNLTEIEQAFVAANQARADAMIVSRDLMLLDHRHKVVALAEKNHLPACYGFAEYVAAGGLMSYGRSIAEQYRRAASYVDRILKGARPRDLPVEQPTTLELVLNLKTASALGITFPPNVLVLADKVIE